MSKRAATHYVIYLKPRPLGLGWLVGLSEVVLGHGQGTNYPRGWGVVKLCC